MRALMSVLTISAVLACGTAWALPVSFSVDPRATFLHTNSDPGAASPLIVDLTALGIAAGQTIQIESLGDFRQASAAPDTVTVMIGVFSATNTLGSATADGPANVKRVTGAIEAGPDVVTVPTFFGAEPTDFPEDFLIDDNVSVHAAVVGVPAGALFLFIGTHDSHFSDNGDPDGDFAVRISAVVPVSEPAGLALLMGGMIAAWSRRGPRR